MEELINTGKEIFPDLHEASCKLGEIGDTHEYFGLKEKLQEKYDALKDSIYDKYRYLLYSFNQSYLDRHLNIDKTVPNTPSKICKTNPDLFINLTCEEGLIIASYVNSINTSIKTSRQIMIDDLIQFKNKIEIILNKTEEKLPEFTFLQTIMNYEISKIKDSISFKKIFFNGAQNMIILSLVIISLLNVPDSFQKVYELSIFELILQIIINGGDLYLKGYETYKENALKLFKKRMEKTNYKGKINQNSIYNIMAILNTNIGLIIEKIQKFTSNKIISVDKFCLNHLDLCYYDECVDEKASIKLLEKLKSSSGLSQFTDFESVLGEHLVSLEIFMKDVTNKIYDKIINFFEIDKLKEPFKLNQQVLKSIINEDFIDIYNNNTEKNVIIDSTDNNFFNIINDSNKNFLYGTINVLIKIILNIIKTFDISINDETKDNLKTKIKNTIYVNVIKSTIINIEFKDKTQIPSVKKIKDIITKRLGKEVPSNLLNNDKKTDGIIFKKYSIPFYNLVILNFILEHISFKFSKYDLYKFNVL